MKCFDLWTSLKVRYKQSWPPPKHNQKGGFACNNGINYIFRRSVQCGSKGSDLRVPLVRPGWSTSKLNGPLSRQSPGPGEGSPQSTQSQSIQQLRTYRSHHFQDQVTVYYTSLARVFLIRVTDFTQKQPYFRLHGEDL